ncbi:MAG: hypothetical protein KA275_04655 [Chitinophagaceae bacterium]|nr:hypothetical protein [Chitinophagaceae bacterium]
MLNGKKNINFKRAVFLTENAFHNGKLDYTVFCNEISTTGQQLKTLIKQKGFEKFKTAGNWAVFTFMQDSLPINNFKPYTYDFTDFMGDKDWTKMFVIKLMKTKSGNCHSLPAYYKILCEEIGAKASLALAPNHLYIKHIDEKGQWINVELTNGGFPRDQWIIKEMAISVEAIKNEVYMKPLSAKESIALCMFDLANAYQFQFGYDSVVLKMVNIALLYFPKCIPLIQTKANCYQTLGIAEKEKKNMNLPLAKKYYLSYQECIAKINEVGYREEAPEHYEEWVKEVESEKQKRAITTNNK